MGNAVVTELVDVLVSGTSFRKGVGVSGSPIGSTIYTNSCKYYSPNKFIRKHPPYYFSISAKFPYLRKLYPKEV